MSDIVERLEDMQERLVLSSDDDIIIFEAVSEIKKLRAAGEGVVKWWLEGGSMRLEGAPYCMFALRRALDGERAAAALRETGDD